MRVGSRRAGSLSWHQAGWRDGRVPASQAGDGIGDSTANSRVIAGVPNGGGA